MLYFFFLNLPLFTVAGSLPTPYTAVDDSLYDGHPPSAPKLQKLGLAFDFGNPIANGAIILIVLLNVIVYYLRELQESKLDDKPKQNYSLPLPSSEHQLCHRFSFGELQLATNNFSDASVIGRGGFGKVYKGVIDSGASIVAIKRLKLGSHQGAPEFRTEIELLSRFRHSHIVSLIGYCDECHEKILVYKYMPRGTLADHLHKIDKPSNAPLSWVQRLNISIGAARGLDYLHTGTGFKDRVIHRDVKSSNILLEEDWAAKISDFGMSKVGPANQSCTHVSTHVKGTFGYLDPDYHSTGQLTRKSDVYSFGVVLFEVMCGRPAVDTRLEDEEQWGLAGWAKHCIKEGKVDQIIDPSLQGKILSDCLMVFVQIAEQCLHNRPKKRPTMAEVVAKLEYALALQERNGKIHPNMPKFTQTYEKHIELPCGPVSVRQIIKATHNFSTKMEIGRGAFGIVYKAQLHGQVVVVKKLSTPSKQKLKEFNTEVHTISSLKHENLVQLFGAYSGEELHLLIYEYMEHNSIAEALFGTRSSLKLDWETRYEICLGIAKGLKYLHEEAIQFVHIDIKAQNILLGGTDGNLKVKISDFGFAMLFEEEDEIMVRRVAGGYLAPEYALTGIWSQKADVYSFGVLLLEIVSGKNNAVLRPNQDTVYLLDTAYVYNEVGRLAELVDKDLSSCYDFTGAMRILNLAMMCTSQTPTLRPTMSEVVSVLQDEKTVPASPWRPSE